jgi:hypothetical protein
MPRYTSAYSSFITRLSEVNLLCRAAIGKEKMDAIAHRKEIDALCRGAIVLLCSHVEAYIKELGEVTLDRLHSSRTDRSVVSQRVFYNISKDVISEIKDTSDHDLIAEKIFGFSQSDLSFWSKTGPFPIQIPAERFNKGFSNPGFDKIKGYFHRFGYEEFRKDFYRKLKAKGTVTHNMVDHMVSTRNNIAHGDPSATKTPSDILDMISIVKLFCRTTDDVFCGWCRSKLCKLR